jgi:hypothetical protein
MININNNNNEPRSYDWVFLHASKISNFSNGFQISLDSGNWAEPKNLNIKAEPGYPKTKYAQQIREGLEYAKSKQGICDLASLYAKKPPIKDDMGAS